VLAWVFTARHTTTSTERQRMVTAGARLTGDLYRNRLAILYGIDDVDELQLTEEHYDRSHFVLSTRGFVVCDYLWLNTRHWIERRSRQASLQIAVRLSDDQSVRSRRTACDRRQRDHNSACPSPGGDCRRFRHNTMLLAGQFPPGTDTQSTFARVVMLKLSKY